MPITTRRCLATSIVPVGLAAVAAFSLWGSQAVAGPPPAVLDVDGDTELGALTDGLLILRFLFGFSGETLTTGAVDTDNCSRCDADAITVYLGPSGLSGPSADAPITIGVGTEFQVNAYTPLYQHEPAVGIAAAGSFVVAWDTTSDYGGSGEIVARRFDSTGSPLGELQVAASAPYQRYPAMAVAADGDFVVAWENRHVDGDQYGVFARSFASDGSPVTGELQVNAYTTGGQRLPDVIRAGDGGFVVAWQAYGQDGSSNGIFLRRFDSAGAPLAAELQVNTVTSGSQFRPALAGNAAGYVVVWASDGEDGQADGIFARHFDSAGSPGAVFQINQYTPDDQTRPTVALASGGGFVVLWESYGQDGDDFGVFGRRVGSGGAPLAAEFQVNAYTPGNQSRASLARDVHGNLAVAWRSVAQDGQFDGVFGRRLAADGSPDSDEGQVNTYTVNNQGSPAVAQNAVGDIVVVWDSAGQDGELDGVFAQRYLTLAALDVDGSGELGALTDGLLILRFLFGFTGPTLTNGAVAGNCMRCSPADILAYLQTLD